MLAIAFVDRTGSGLWASVSVLYFTYVSHLSVVEVGTLAAVAGAVGIVGAPLGGRLADRLPITRFLVALQLLRAVASFALLTTDNYALLITFSAVGGLGDRGANVLTKLYATRIAGPDRVRYQAVSRTAANAGWPWAASPQRPHSPSAPPPHTAGSSSATPSPSSRQHSSPCAAANPRPRPAPSPPPRKRQPGPGRPTPVATAPTSRTSLPKLSSSSTTPSSRSACPCGSPTPAPHRTASHPC
jgi:hypothetical protein